METQNTEPQEAPRAPQITPRVAYRKRRQRRQGKVFNVIVVLMGISSLVALLILTGLLKFPYYNSFNKVERFAEKGNIVCVGKNVKPADLTGVKIKVFNGTSRAGLADTVGTALAGVGLEFTEKANYDGQFFGNIRIVTNGKNVVNAYSLARLFEGASVYYDPDAADVIQIIVGDAFTEMKPAEELKAIAEKRDVEFENPEGCLKVKE